MLDRLSELNQLLSSIFKKADSIEDMDDIPIYGPSESKQSPKSSIIDLEDMDELPIAGTIPEKQPKQKVFVPTKRFGPGAIQDKPAQVPPPFIPKVELNIPKQEPVVTAPVEIKPEPVKKEDKPKRELPSWFDPAWSPLKKSEPKPSQQRTWSPIKKIQLPSEQFSTSHWSILDKPEVVEQVITQESKSTTQENKPLSSKDDAITYLKSLPKNSSLTEVLDSLTIAENELKTGSKKLIASTLSAIIAHLLTLKNNTDNVFGENKERGFEAIEILIDYFNQKVKELPERYQSNLKVLQQAEGRKAAPVKELTSQWYGPELLFINNRAIRLLRGGVDSIDKAEQQAQEEWKLLNEFVDGFVPNYDAKDKLELKKIGSQNLLGGGTFEDSKKLIIQRVEAVESGAVSIDNLNLENTVQTLFPDVHIDPESNWVDLAESLQNGSLEDDLEDLSDGIRESIIPKIIDFAKKAIEFNKIQDYRERNLSNDEVLLDTESKLQLLFDEISNITRQIFSIPTTEINKSEISHDIFQDIYSVYRIITLIAPQMNIESVFETPISGAQTAGAGLGIDIGSPISKETEKTIIIMMKKDADKSDIDNIAKLLAELNLTDVTKTDTKNGISFRAVGNIENEIIEQLRKASGVEVVTTNNPRHRRPNESIEDFKNRQKHEKELADASRYRYLQRIIQQGDAAGYLARKRQYKLERRKGETDIEFEKRKERENKIEDIRNPEYKENQQEFKKLRYFAASNISDLQDKLKSFLATHKARTIRLFKRINNSDLSNEELSKLEQELLENRIEKYTDFYNTLKSKTDMNPNVIKFVELLIEQIPQFFNDAKEKYSKDKNSVANIVNEMSNIFVTAVENKI